MINVDKDNVVDLFYLQLLSIRFNTHVLSWFNLSQVVIPWLNKTKERQNPAKTISEIFPFWQSVYFVLPSVRVEIYEVSTK